MCMHMQKCRNKNEIINKLKTKRVFVGFAFVGHKKHLTGSNLHKLIINKLETDEIRMLQGIGSIKARFMTQSWEQSHLTQTELLDHEVANNGGGWDGA